MDQQRPFDGLKVLAVARIYAAPFAAYQLALHGAEVINIETPDGGDITRSTRNAHGEQFYSKGMGTAFIAHAANKKSLTLNFREPEAQEIFRNLAKDADVVMENMRAGGMAAFGLDYGALRKINPRLIYCSLTGYGQTGPKKGDAAFDAVIQAASGMMSITGMPESGPVKTGATVIDYASGFAMALGIVTALYQRERTGQGQYIDVSMMETAFACMSSVVSDVMNAGVVTKLHGNRSANNNPISNSLRCSDAFIMVSATLEGLRKAFFEAIGRTDIPRDPRFATHELLRRNSDALYEEIEKTLRTRTAAEWEDILNAARVPCMKVYSIKEAVESPQVRSRDFFHVFDRIPGVDEKVAVPLAPYRLSEGAARIDAPPPTLGQHNEELLRGLGYGKADIERLHKAGVI